MDFSGRGCYKKKSERTEQKILNMIIADDKRQKWKFAQKGTCTH